MSSNIHTAKKGHFCSDQEFISTLSNFKIAELIITSPKTPTTFHSPTSGYRVV